jgi:predicted O-methyltransferase YrrM
VTSVFRRALRKLRGDSPPTSTPLQHRSTYAEPGNQWYFPPVTGPASFLADVAGAEPVTLALNVLEILSPDAYLDFVRNFYKAGLANIGPTWVYADINTVLMGLARRLAVQNYLEIGVRRGRSMAMVASQVPDCRIVGFDMWVDDYAGMENPGPAHVRSELQRVGYSGSLEFIDGDSKDTVPAYFAAHPNEYFDLITVDGDHSTKGARRDLENVIPRLKIGGALVFDDISNQSHPTLASVWKSEVEDDSRFASYSFAEVGFGVGFAIRRR